MLVWNNPLQSGGGQRSEIVNLRLGVRDEKVDSDLGGYVRLLSYRERICAVRQLVRISLGVLGVLSRKGWFKLLNFISRRL